MNKLRREAVIRVMRAKQGKNPFRLRKWNAAHLHIQKRHQRETRFQLLGLFSVVFSIGFLVLLLISIFTAGIPAFWHTQMRLTVQFDPAVLTAESPEQLAKADYKKLLNQALLERFPQVQERREKFQLYALLSSSNSGKLREMVERNSTLIGTSQTVWLDAASDVDMLMKGNIPRDGDETLRKLKDNQIAWLDELEATGNLRRAFNRHFFTNADSSAPEEAGVLGAVIGSLFTLLICMAVALPIGVGAATYLEEFCPKNKWAEWIEININNLAAVPSIIYGLLALEIYLNLFGMPRSSPLVGGLTSALLVLPVIIITTRNALKAVPNSIRYAAMAMGATKVQTTFHHTLIYALPGIMTGVILSIARALGETAPLLMVGMVAFMADIPSGFTSAATVLPVQIFLWSDKPEAGFIEKTSACIMVLLVFLTLANGLAVYLRKKFYTQW